MGNPDASMLKVGQWQKETNHFVETADTHLSIERDTENIKKIITSSNNRFLLLLFFFTIAKKNQNCHANLSAKKDDNSGRPGTTESNISTCPALKNEPEVI